MKKKRKRNIHIYRDYREIFTALLTMCLKISLNLKTVLVRDNMNGATNGILFFFGNYKIHSIL
jgi:hypothetical protein